MSSFNLRIGEMYEFKNSNFEKGLGEYFGTFLFSTSYKTLRHYLFESLDDSTNRFGRSYKHMQEEPENHKEVLKLIHARYPNRRDIPGNARYCSRLMEDILLGTTIKTWLMEQLKYAYE